MGKMMLTTEEYAELMIELSDLRKLRDSIHVEYPTKAEIDEARESVKNGDNWPSVPFRVFMDGRAAERTDAMQSILGKAADHMEKLLVEFDHDYLGDLSLYRECVLNSQSIYVHEKKVSE